MKRPTKAKYSHQKATTFGWGEKSVPRKNRQKMILSQIEGKKIIDIGCGTGVWTDLLSRAGFEVTGIDQEDSFIKKAKKTKKGKFIKTKAENLPFKNKEFDTGLLINALEHVDDDLLVLKKAARAAKKLIINVPQTTPENLSSKGVVYKHHLDQTHQRTYSSKSLKDLIAKAGLELIFIKKVEPLPSKWLTFELLDGRPIFKKIATYILFTILRPKKYHLELFAVAKIK